MATVKELVGAIKARGSKFAVNGLERDGGASRVVCAASAASVLHRCSNATVARRPACPRATALTAKPASNGKREATQIGCAIYVHILGRTGLHLY